MHQYAIIATCEGKPWMGLYLYLDSHLDSSWFHWREEKFSPISYDRRFLPKRVSFLGQWVGPKPWMTPGYRKLRRLKDEKAWAFRLIEEGVSTSEKALNYWVHGSSENEYAYRLAKHFLALEKRHLPKGYEAKVYRVGSKEFLALSAKQKAECNRRTVKYARS